MKNTRRLSAIERAAKVQLEAVGYTVVPMKPCFATRSRPVHLMAWRDTGGLIYLKLKVTARPLPDSIAVEQFCRDDARLLRRLFPLSPGPVALHLEIWILPDTGRFACYEVMADKIQEVFHV